MKVAKTLGVIGLCALVPMIGVSALAAPTKITAMLLIENCPELLD